MLKVTTPAANPWLLTIEQARVAAGLASNDTSLDTSLQILLASVSAAIFDALNIAVGNGAEPTIRKERLTETVLVAPQWPIVLKRRHNVSVVSVEGWPGVTGPDDYIVEAEAGILRRADGCILSRGPGSRATIVYDAGFDVVPPVLVAAANDMLVLRRAEVERESPLLKKEVVDVDGIDRVEREYWVTAAGASAQTQPVPPSILATLKRFRNSIYG